MNPSRTEIAGVRWQPAFQFGCRKRLPNWLLALLGFVIAGGCNPSKTYVPAESTPAVHSASSEDVGQETTRTPPSRPAGQGEQSTSPPNDATETATNGLVYLVLGNSHTNVGNPFGQLTAMLKTRLEPDEVDHHAFSGPFLENLSDVPHDPATFRPQPDFVILQGQKYSMSGQYDYPIDAAVQLVEQFNSRGCRVLLMPEWRVRGNLGEAQRAAKIYERICDQAVRQNTDVEVEVVPVGLVWDRVMDTLPELDFYQPDGNHANRLGGYLTALTFYCWLYDEPPSGTVPKNLQPHLEQIQALTLDVCREYRKARATAPATRESSR